MLGTPRLEEQHKRQGVVCLSPKELVSHPDPACLYLQPKTKACPDKLLPPSESMGTPLTTSVKPGRTGKRGASGASLISGLRSLCAFPLGLRFLFPMERFQTYPPGVGQGGGGGLEEEGRHSKQHSPGSPFDPTALRLLSPAGICLVAYPGETPPSHHQVPVGTTVSPSSKR